MSFQSLVGKDRSGSAFLPALTFSVVLHFFLFWPAYPGIARQAGSPPMAATLRAVAAPVPAVPPGPDRSAPAGKIATKPALPRETMPGAKVVAESVAPAVAGGEGPGSASGMESVALGRGAAALAAGQAAGLDADGIRSYRIGLAREARSHRRYPPLALERGWTGTAEVQVDVSRQGRARQILLARSSGHEILDREAVAMMSHAAASAALPDSLRGQEFAVRLPVVFDLADVQ